MKRVLTFFAVVAFAAAAVGVASAASYNKPLCGGELMVNVTYRLTNDFDSGVHGNAWANDSINRHVQIFAVGSGNFCAAINDTGTFTTFAGDSPSGTGTVTAGIKGVINGGYVTTVFAGTLNPAPAYATRGNLGSFDLQCTDASTCPGARPSFLSYVTGAWDFADWGWSYHTARNGDWINSAAANTGDITG